MKTSLKFLCDHGLTLLVGAMLGGVISLGLKYEDATDFWAAFGAMLAGVATTALLWFGWVKSDDWIKQSHHSKKLDVISNSHTQISSLIYELNAKFLNHLEHKFKRVAAQIDLLKNKGISRNDVEKLNNLNNLRQSKDEFLILLDRVVVLIDIIMKASHSVDEDDYVKIQKCRNEIRDSFDEMMEDYFENELDSTNSFPRITSELIQEDVRDQLDGIWINTTRFSKCTSELIDKILLQAVDPK